MRNKYIHVVDGTIQVPMPDDPAARAKAFGEVAAAWSVFLSAIGHLLPVGAGGKLTGGAREATWPSSPIRPYVATPSAESAFAQGYQQGLSEAETIARAGSSDSAGSNGAQPSVPVNGGGTEKPAAKANSVPRASGNHTLAHMAKMRAAAAAAAKRRKREARRAAR